MKPRILISLAVMLFLCAAFARPQETPKEQRHGNPVAPENGALAPDFTLNLIGEHGKPVRLSSLKGKAVLLNFWATWCEPCKIEMPWLVELQKKYGPQGLQVVGVAMDDAGDKAIAAFAHKMGVNYVILQGTEKVADLYGGLEGLPTTFFLDRSGIVVDQAMGLESESLIEDSIKKSLGNETTNTASAK
jgi:cytochrome c biogenesis protein CcmG/thiol:disulfide interchange protein DsbE